MKPLYSEGSVTIGCIGRVEGIEKLGDNGRISGFYKFLVGCSETKFIGVGGAIT